MGEVVPVVQRSWLKSAAVACGCALLLAACSDAGGSTSSDDAGSSPDSTVSERATPTPTPTPTQTPSAEPSPTATPSETAPPPPPPPPVVEPPPPPPPPVEPKTSWRRGDSGPEVAAIQQKLTALGYRPGSADGSYGAATASAVLAFQKREGLSRDGSAGPQTLGRLDAPQGAGPQSTSGPRIEADLSRQIVFVIDGNGGVTTVNASSGNGKEYQRAPESGGGIGVATTPTGSFSVQRRIDGWREAPLGLMYQPMYFKGGFAVHGSNSVPAYAASHGCVRVSVNDSNFIWGAIPNGAPVSLYSS